jgi:general secretion pathway protein L
VLPLSPHTLAFIRDIDSAAGAANPSSTDVVAEPAVAQGAEQLLGGGVTIQSAAQRLLLSSRSDWDLAQLDLARTGTARMTKRAAAVWRDFLHAPLWRPARWGVGLLLLANVVGLNLWAWQTQRDLTARRAQINSLLTATFPQVKVVVDAPVQMQRELAALRQATGAASPRDLEPMLTAVARGLPPKTVPAGVDFSVGELRLKGVPLTAEPLDIGNQRLRPQGYQLRSDGDSVVLREGGAP